jgi:xylulokinase
MADGRYTAGIDIGTSSVKAVIADEDGNVVRAARVPHDFRVPAPLRFEHDARVAWFDGPRAALAALGDDIPLAAVSVAAMVPSLTAVDVDGTPCAPGLLYGDERGHQDVAPDGARGKGAVVESGELGRFLAWLAREVPDARGFWPAQAVANFALTGTPVLSTTAAAACFPLFDFGAGAWSESLVQAAGGSIAQLPTLVAGGAPAGEVQGRVGCVLEGGLIDAMGEQIVAGADADGDVLVICGTTLIVWCVNPKPEMVPGYYPIPHTAPGKFLVGGPSNAGGLFLNWAQSLLRDPGDPDHDALDRGNVPLWVPYPRGERVPVQDSARRAELHCLDLTHGPAAIRRAAFEAAGFVTRRMIEASPEPARRIVATGGGVRVDEWIETLAYCTRLPVDVVAVPEGGARGAAFLARMGAGLEAGLTDASRWARIERRVEPDARWAAAAADRYGRWLELAQ